MKRPLLWILGVWIMGEIVASWFGIAPVPAAKLDLVMADRNSASVQVTGTITQFRHTSSGKYSYTLSETEVLLEGQIYDSSLVLVFTGDISDLAIGNQVCVTGKLSLFDVPSNPGQFDLRSYYRSQGIGFSLNEKRRQKTGEEVRMLPQTLWRLREEMRSSLLAVSDAEEAGVFLSVFLGDRSMMDSEVRDLYQTGGISHVLAISGLHISLFGMALHEFLRRVGCPFFLNLGISGGILAAYVRMTGASASASRALIMFLVFLLARALGRTYDLLSALSLAGILLLLEQPLLLWEGGFQLSFLAMIAVGAVWPVGQRILEQSEQQRIRQRADTGQMDGVENGFRILFDNMFQVVDRICRRSDNEEQVENQKNAERKRESLFTRLDEWIFGKDGWYGSLKRGLGFSLAIQLTTMPILAWNYYTIPVYSLILNLLVLPFAGLLLGSAAAAAALGLLAGRFFGGLAHVAILPAKAVLVWYDRMCHLTEILPGHSMVVGKPRVWQILLYYVVFILGMYLLDHIRREKRVGVLWILLLFLLIQRVPGTGLQITAIDVGQGDAVFVRSAGGSCCLIDGGSSSVSDVGEWRILPYLKSQGVGHLDAVLVSHGDADHINGLSKVLTGGQISIGYLGITEAAEHDPEMAEVLAAAKEAGVDIRILHPGDTWKLGRSRMTCLYPSQRAAEAWEKDKNDSSMVLLLEQQGFSALFTGDLAEDGERELLGLYPMEKVDLLKVGHHGSKNSSSERFLTAIRPEFALISCGEKNTYGHPHDEAILRLSEAGARILRTDRGGALTVTVRGGRGQAQSYLEPDGG